MARYIDADAFETFGYAVDGGNDDFKDGFDEGVQFVLECIDEQPTADVRENVKGKWVKENIVLTSYPPQYQWHCSVCGKLLQGFDKSILTNYCPHCGADMRGEKDV